MAEQRLLEGERGAEFNCRHERARRAWEAAGWQDTARPETLRVVQMQNAFGKWLAMVVWCQECGSVWMHSATGYGSTGWTWPNR